MKSAKQTGITLVSVAAFTLALSLGSSGPNLVPVAHADDDHPRFHRSCGLESLRGSYGISTTGFIVSAGP